MFEAVRRIGAVLIPIAALTVIVVGLWPRAEPVVDDQERVRAIAANIRCPFCAGESIAESTSSVSADYRTLIEEWVGAGLSDDEIYDRFVERFGEGIILDPGRASWGIALWLIPLAALAVGAVAIVGLRRGRARRVAEPVETVAEEISP